MLRRLTLRDVIIVSQLEVDLDAGFTVLTGETGAGKSILIDALQLALGGRGDAGLVREGCARAEVTAEFDAPLALAGWLEEAGFSGSDDDARLLLRRSIDAQGKSRAWINGSPATLSQLREAGELLVDIHGQHAWQSLTRPAAVRALLDEQAGVDGSALTALWQAWKAAEAALADARARGETLERERERLAWQIGELDKLAPGESEWDELNAEHQRLAHAQSLLDGVRAALLALSDGEPAADTLAGQAIDALDQVIRYDALLSPVLEALQGAQAQLQDAAHGLHAYLSRSEPDPARLAELDARLSAWLSLARRYRRPPAELPALLAGWKQELHALDAASDLEALDAAVQRTRDAWHTQAQRVGKLRRTAAPKLAAAVSLAMQQLGMAGGRFEVELVAQAAPQAFGLESAEFLVAGHAGSSPRPLAKVASGGELSRLALAVAVTTCGAGARSRANAHLRRDRRRRRRQRGLPGRALDETAGRQQPGAGGDASGAGGGLRRSSLRRLQGAAGSGHGQRCATGVGRGTRDRGRTHAWRGAPGGHQPRACASHARRRQRRRQGRHRDRVREADARRAQTTMRQR